MVHLILSHRSARQLASPQLVPTCSFPLFLPFVFSSLWILSNGFSPQAPLAGAQQGGHCLGNRFGSRGASPPAWG